jgi:hypothetical protein
MEFILRIELGNEEMRTGRDVQRAISASITTMTFGTYLRDGDAAVIRDLNGNVVGKWEVLP